MSLFEIKKGPGLRKPRSNGIWTYEDMLKRAKKKENGCIEWQGSKCGPGYGEAWSKYDKRKIMAHRLAYMLKTRKEIEKGMEIDHTCNNRLCINVDHLQAITHKKNKELEAERRNKKRKTCKRGHEWTKENLYTLKGSRRVSCKLCSRESAKKTRDKYPERYGYTARKQYFKLYYKKFLQIRNSTNRLKRNTTTGEMNAKRVSQRDLMLARSLARGRIFGFSGGAVTGSMPKSGES